MQMDVAPGAERPAETGERNEWEAFRHEISGLERTLGPQVSLPENPTDEELQKLAESTRERVLVTNFNELTRANEIAHKRYAIQQAANLERGVAFDRESYIASMQAATYCEGLGYIGQFIADSLRNYELCQDIIVALPPEQRKILEGKRRQSTVFIRMLRQAMDERMRFTNIRQVMGLLAEEQARVPDQRRQDVIDRLTKQRDDILPTLSDDSRKIANITNPTPEQVDAMWRHANALERRIIGIASGTERVEGVDQGFVPTTLYLEVLQARYQQIQTAQKAMVDRGELQREGGPAAMQLLNREREAVMSQMVMYSNDLVGYQLRMTQLSSMQRLKTS